MLVAVVLVARVRGCVLGACTQTPCRLLLATRYLQLGTHYLLLTTCYSLLATRYSLIATHRLLLTPHYSLQALRLVNAPLRTLDLHGNCLFPSVTVGVDPQAPPPFHALPIRPIEKGHTLPTTGTQGR